MIDSRYGVTLEDIAAMAKYIVASRLFGIKEESQAVSLMLLAQAEGMHPMAAIQDFDIIKGKPARKTHSILARFQSAGGTVAWEEISKKRACGTFTHKSGGSLKVEWTLATAQEIGITRQWDEEKREWKNKTTWAQYPQAMLRARCIAEGIRAVYPAAIGGHLSVEEAQDLEAVEVETKPAVEQPRAKSERPAIEYAPSESMPEPLLPPHDVVPTKREPVAESGPTKPASKSALHVVEVKLEQAGLSTNDMLEKFGFGMEGINLSNINDVLEWIKNPME